MAQASALPLVIVSVWLRPPQALSNLDSFRFFKALGWGSVVDGAEGIRLKRSVSVAACAAWFSLFKKNILCRQPILNVLWRGVCNWRHMLQQILPQLSQIKVFKWQLHLIGACLKLRRSVLKQSFV